MSKTLVLIDAALLKDTEDALKIAKITMMMMKSTVFYTTILLSLKQKITYDIPVPPGCRKTAATNGEVLLIAPDFFLELHANERIGLLAHEVLHVALDHMHRRGKRDPDLWNIAADYVINGYLKKAKYALPQGGLFDNKYDDKTTEEVYDILDKKSEQQKRDMTSGYTGDVMYPEDAEAGSEVSQQSVTEVILRATTQAKAMGQDPGSVPGEVDIELQRTLNPPLPWHVILVNYLSEFSKDDYSFRTPNKRFLPNFYLPTAYSEAICNLVFIVDASSSVSTNEFNNFISKIDECIKQMSPTKVTVVDFTTKINRVQELKAGCNPFKELKFNGCGGTAIGPVHKWLAENKPTVAIIFTDGEFRQTEPINKSIPIVWLIHNNKQWVSNSGRVIHYDI